MKKMCLLLVLSITSFSFHYSTIFPKAEAGYKITVVLDDYKSILKHIVVVGNDVIIIYEGDSLIWKQ